MKLGTARQATNKFIYITYQCTHDACQQVFIATHGVPYKRNPSSSTVFADLMRVAPTAPRKKVFAVEIEEISPTFVAIHDQVMHAEGEGLDQLVGIGLRKALEFLIKDYAITENESNTEEIQRMTLNQCMQRYIADANIRACAERAAWLGNDETHYIKKWEAMDINDLKRLMTLTINWIENSLITKKYLAEMQRGSDA